MKSFIKVLFARDAIAVALVACTAQKEEPRVSESKSAPPALLALRSASSLRRAVGGHFASFRDDRKALDKSSKAARLLDPLFLRQVLERNEALLKSSNPTRARGS